MRNLSIYAFAQADGGHFEPACTRNYLPPDFFAMNNVIKPPKNEAMAVQRTEKNNVNFMCSASRLLMR